METMMRTLIAMLAGVVPALAAKGETTEDGGLLLMAFLGFGAIIVTFQIIPAVVLFASMVKGLFLPKLEKAAVAAKDSDR
ncbi:MAG: hypothetical protein EHM51_00455 [Geobacter sp.]|nr:MAG: hypothetical protein EHM51_00455 [Geobacter sp.]